MTFFFFLHKRIIVEKNGPLSFASAFRLVPFHGLAFNWAVLAPGPNSVLATAS